MWSRKGRLASCSTTPSSFDFGKVQVAEPLGGNAGFAGFRVDYLFEDGEVPQELLTFLGASYFRAVARDTRFGISARGLALETGLGKPEEFPAFTHFWVLRPSNPRDPLQICALLDSQSVAGAYRFDVAPRDGTLVAVDSSLFFRADISQVGIAPLTSMYLLRLPTTASASTTIAVRSMIRTACRSGGRPARPCGGRW